MVVDVGSSPSRSVSFGGFAVIGRLQISHTVPSATAITPFCCSDVG